VLRTAACICCLDQATVKSRAAELAGIRTQQDCARSLRATAVVATAAAAAVHCRVRKRPGAFWPLGCVGVATLSEFVCVRGCRTRCGVVWRRYRRILGFAGANACAAAMQRCSMLSCTSLV
jgi:hypothetical protein